MRNWKKVSAHKSRHPPKKSVLSGYTLESQQMTENFKSQPCAKSNTTLHNNCRLHEPFS